MKIVFATAQGSAIFQQLKLFIHKTDKSIGRLEAGTYEHAHTW